MLERIKFIPEDYLNMLQLAWNPVKKEIEPMITLGKCELQITDCTPITVQINLPQNFKNIVEESADAKSALIKICKLGIENVTGRHDVLATMYNEFDIPENVKEISELVERLYNNYVEDIYFTNFLKTISSEYGVKIYDPDLYSQIKPLFTKSGNDIYMNFGEVISSITNISEGFEFVKARELSWIKVNMYSSKVELQRFNRVFGPVFETLLPEANETRETTTGQLMEKLKDIIINKTKVLVKHNIIISEAISECPMLIGYHDDTAYFLQLGMFSVEFVKVPLVNSTDITDIYTVLTIGEMFEDDSEVIYAVNQLYKALLLLRNKDFVRLTYVAYYGNQCLSRHTTKSWNYARFKPIDKESFTVTIFDQEDTKVYEFKYAQGLYIDTTDETEPSLVAVGDLHPDFIMVSHDLASEFHYGL